MQVKLSLHHYSEWKVIVRHERLNQSCVFAKLELGFNSKQFSPKIDGDVLQVVACPSAYKRKIASSLFLRGRPLPPPLSHHFLTSRMKSDLTKSQPSTTQSYIALTVNNRTIKTPTMGLQQSKDTQHAASNARHNEHGQPATQNERTNVSAWNAVYNTHKEEGNKKFLHDHTTVQARKDAYKDLEDNDAKIEYPSQT